MAKKRKGVRAISDSSIELDFEVNGERWRPRLQLKPTPANMNAAENILAATKLEIIQGVFNPEKYFPNYSKTKRYVVLHRKQTVADALNEWIGLDHVKQRYARKKTYVTYRNDINNILIPALGDIPIDQLRRSDINTRLVEKHDVVQKRLNNILTPLRHALNRLFVDEGAHVLTNWTPQAIKQSRTDDHIEPFSLAEMNLILAEFKSDALLYNAVEFAYETGMRVSEWQGLQWENVNFAERFVLVKHSLVEGHLHPAPKTKKGYRVIDLSEKAYQALIRQKQHSFLQGTYVFVNDFMGYIDSQTFRRRWQAVLKKAGVHYRAPKQLRHTWATHALAVEDIKNWHWISNQLGHETVEFTQKVYFRFVRNLYPDAGEKLAKMRSQFDDENADAMLSN